MITLRYTKEVQNIETDQNSGKVIANIVTDQNCEKVVANSDTGQNSEEIVTNVETGQNLTVVPKTTNKTRAEDRVRNMKEFVQNELGGQ